MKLAIGTNHWQVFTDESLNTKEGLKQLKQAAELLALLVRDLEEYFNFEKEGAE